MSFSTELKTELCKLKSSECCRRAELFAMAAFGLVFSREKISVITQTHAVAQNFAYLLKKNFGINTNVYSSSGVRPTHTIKLIGTNAAAVFDALNNYTPTENDCCKNAFLRGAFLSCGQISNPEKSIRIDFRVKNPDLTTLLCDALKEKNLEFKVSGRQNFDLIYIKKSESVEDLITIMGAGNITLKIMDAKMINELRNNTNRKANLEVSNLDKIVNSSLIQRNAIKKIISSEKFETLPDDLKEAALLRMANPEASLKELCKLCDYSITRSGFNHKLQKLIEIANNIK